MLSRLDVVKQYAKILLIIDYSNRKYRRGRSQTEEALFYHEKVLLLYNMINNRDDFLNADFDQHFMIIH